MQCQDPSLQSLVSANALSNLEKPVVHILRLHKKTQGNEKQKGKRHSVYCSISMQPISIENKSFTSFSDKLEG